MSTSLYKQMISIHSAPLPFILLTAVISVGLVATFWLGWAIWQVAILVILAWLPLFFLKTVSIQRQYGWLSFSSWWSPRGHTFSNMLRRWCKFISWVSVGCKRAVSLACSTLNGCISSGTPGCYSVLCCWCFFSARTPGCGSCW